MTACPDKIGLRHYVTSFRAEQAVDQPGRPVIYV